MARFYFHVFNGHGHTPDEEGTDLPDQAAARRMALESICSMVAEDVRGGLIDLKGRIVISDHNASHLTTVHFADAFELRIPDDRPSS